MGQFSVGEGVTCIPHLICRSAAPGDYKIVGEMPVRDGEHMYRIKSPLEEHERVVSESLLVRSERCFPDCVATLASATGNCGIGRLPDGPRSRISEFLWSLTPRTLAWSATAAAVPCWCKRQ
jgi:hypothetical protein